MKTLRKLFCNVVGLLALTAISVTNITAEEISSSRGKVIPYAGKSAGQQPRTVREDSQTASEAAAVARTRKQIQMLDDLYKTAVVLITEHYVNDPSILSAATASKALLAAMNEKGWHEGRLLGFTDVLFNADENAPKDDFERTAKKKLLQGEVSHEEVVTKNGKRYLRMATQVPVVMEKCIMCHADFKGKKGAIGGLSYTVPLIY